MKIVEGDTFYSYYILYQYFENSKIRQKFKNNSIVKKAQAIMLISHRRVLHNFKTIEGKL